MFLRLVLWSALGCAGIALSLGLLILISILVVPPYEGAGWDDVPLALEVLLYLGMGWSVMYGPWVLAWPLLVRRVPAVERRWRAFLLGAVIPAALGGLTFKALLGTMFHTPETLLDATVTFVVPWAALVLSRRIVPALRLGAFAPADPAGAAGG